MREHSSRGARAGRAREWSGLLLVATALGAAGCLTGAPERYRELSHAWDAAEARAWQPAEGEDPLAQAAQLERSALVRAVLERNPSIRAARHAWRAALQRFPQVTALDDPILGYGLAPSSLGEDDVDDAHVLDLSQAIPFPGKLRLRGEVALAEAEASRGDFEAVRLRLATMTSLLFDEHHFLARAVALNTQHAALLESLKRVALARYEVGEATQQDPLQAETERVRLLQQDLVLESRSRINRQQINTLLHRPVEAPLPPAGESLTAPPVPFADAAAASLALEALAARPDHRAAGARVRARETEVRVAQREFLPDFTLVGGYNRRLPVDENRPFVGLRLNLPLQLEARRAAVEEARSRLARAESLQAGLGDQVRLSVHRAFSQWQEARAVAALFEERLLPVARDRIAAAQAGFETGRNSFLELIDAERELRRVELDREQALADLSGRAAALLSAVGRTPGLEGGE